MCFDVPSWCPPKFQQIVSGFLEKHVMSFEMDRYYEALMKPQGILISNILAFLSRLGECHVTPRKHSLTEGIRFSNLNVQHIPHRPGSPHSRPQFRRLFSSPTQQPSCQTKFCGQAPCDPSYTLCLHRTGQLLLNSRKSFPTRLDIPANPPKRTT